MPDKGVGGSPEEDVLARVQARLEATPQAVSELREEIRRLRGEGNRLRRAAALVGLIHHWSEALLEGDLDIKEVLASIASNQGLRHLLLWAKDGSAFKVVGRAGSGGMVETVPLRVGKEIAGATWAIGMPRFFRDLTMAPTAVQRALWAKGKSLLSLPVKGRAGGWVLEVMDHLDGSPLGQRAVDEIPILAPWVGLATFP